MSRNSALLLALSAGLLSGCADYSNRYDTVTLAAGDAQNYNMLLQTAEPFNPASANTAIPTDGKRTVDAVKKYQTSLQPGAAPPSVTINVGTPGN